MGDLAGWVLLGIVVLVFAYILPAAIRSRQVVMDSRAEDRYSGDLRIVATAGHRSAAISSSSRVYVHARRTTEEDPMSSPVDRQLAAADARRLAAARAARAAASSRRAAAARRRLALTALLLVVTAAAWAAVALMSWPIAAAIVPSLALIGVVALGRRASTAGAEADARWERELASITAHSRDRAEHSARVSGRPRLRVDVDPSALLAEEEAPTAAPRPRTAVTSGGWTPIPVPPPAYTLKQAAPRREVSPLVMDAQTELMEPVGVEPADAVDEASVEAEQTEPAVSGKSAEAVEPSEVAESPEPPVAAEPSMNVQAVLARRRAVG